MRRNPESLESRLNYTANDEHGSLAGEHLSCGGRRGGQQGRQLDAQDYSVSLVDAGEVNKLIGAAAKTVETYRGSSLRDVQLAYKMPALKGLKTDLSNAESTTDS